MGATSEFLAMMPRRADGKRNWPSELKARIVAEMLIEGETVKAVAKRYELIPSTVSDWRRLARQGKLVLSNLDGLNFVPVEIEAPAPVAQPLAAISSGTIDVIKGDVTVRLDAAAPATRISTTNPTHACSDASPDITQTAKRSVTRMSDNDLVQGRKTSLIQTPN